MPITFTDEFKINKEIFLETGAFDVILDIDSKFFVDPALLGQCQIPEFLEAKQKVEKYFTEIITLLSFSKNEDDRFWKAANNQLRFTEVSGTCFGYSKNGTRGRGIGKRFRESILMAIKDIMNAGLTDPAIFELVSTFEEGIGCDRISDLITYILLEDIRKYTQRVVSECNLTTFNNSNSNINGLLFNQYNRQPILLIPSILLTPLPLAIDFEDIEYVCRQNQRVRQTLNDDYVFDSKNQKIALKRLLLVNKKFTKEWINAYKTAEISPYDWTSDPVGQYLWYDFSKNIVQDNPLRLQVPSNPTIKDVYSVTKNICTQFKRTIEDLGGWKILYNDDDRPRREEVAQLLFYSIACSYFEANNIDFSRECNNGRGPVDFKLSRGANEKVVVEVKLTSNKQLKHGLSDQIPIYMTQENTEKAIYLIIDNGHETALKNFKEFFKNNYANNKIECIYIDGEKQLSASIA